MVSRQLVRWKKWRSSRGFTVNKPFHGMTLRYTFDERPGCCIIPNSIEASIDSQVCAPVYRLLGSAKTFTTRMIFQWFSQYVEIDQKVIQLHFHRLTIVHSNPDRLSDMLKSLRWINASMCAPTDAQIATTPDRKNQSIGIYQKNRSRSNFSLPSQNRPCYRLCYE